MLLLVAILVLCYLPTPGAADAAEYDPLHAQLQGPQVVATQSVNMYTLSLVGGPAEAGEGNYSFNAQITGKDTSGASIDPNAVEQEPNGPFYINLTAPSVPQTLTITIDCTSANAGTTVKASVAFQVVVVEPVVISASIKNTGDVGARGVPLSLRIYQDGEWVEFYSTTLNLAAGETRDFRYNWTALGLEPGEHKVRMALDPGNELVTFEGGGSVYEATFYYDMPGYGGINSLLWVLVIALGLVAFLLWRRPGPKGRKRR